MSRLTAWLRGEKRPPKMADPAIGADQTGGLPSVIVVDSETVATLEGEPPVAQSKGWGDMSWTRRG